MPPTQTPGAPNVGRTVLAVDAGGELEEAVDVAAGRQLLDLLTGEVHDLACVLNVDDRGRAGHHDGLVQLADRHRRVDVGGEAAGEIDGVTLLLGEAREREHHLVGAHGQVRNTVRAARIGFGGAYLFDQGGARHLHRDPRHQRPGRVTHRPGDLPFLRECHCRQQNQYGSDRQECLCHSTHHAVSSSTRVL